LIKALPETPMIGMSTVTTTPATAVPSPSSPHRRPLTSRLRPLSNLLPVIAMLSHVRHQRQWRHSRPPSLPVSSRSTTETLTRRW
jgi:hypothetical protein